MWSVYDGLISLGPTLKLVGPKSYNQVTRHLAAKVFRGLQIWCSVRTSAQFDELPTPKLWSIILALPQSKIARKTEAMDTASPKTEDAGEGAVGGDQCADPDKYPMSWMHDHQRWYDDKMNSGPALPADRWERNHNSAAGMSPSINLALVISDPSHLLPPTPTNMEIGRWLSLDREGSREDLWMEAYARSLQSVAEVATGWSWMTEDGGMVHRTAPWCKHF